MTPAREFNQLIKTNLCTENAADIICPHQKNDFVACIARDGDMAIENRHCVGCQIAAAAVLKTDMKLFKNRRHLEKITNDLTADETILYDAIILARKMQEFLWQELSQSKKQYDTKLWALIFQKRVDKIADIDVGNPNAKVELRKRLVQQAALSICALRVLDNNGIK